MVPGRVCGSWSSNKTNADLRGRGKFQAEVPRQELHYGIREPAMAATVKAFGFRKVRAFGATFFNFQRLRAARRSGFLGLMEITEHFYLYHDAMGDGGTARHIAGEQLFVGCAHSRWSRFGRATPTVVEAYRYVMQFAPSPAVLVVIAPAAADSESEQLRPLLGCPPRCVGGWPMHWLGQEVIVIATGREVTLAWMLMKNYSPKVSVHGWFSMPSWDIFEDQAQEYREVCAARVKRDFGRTGLNFRLGALCCRRRPLLGMKTVRASAPRKDFRKNSGLS